MIKGPIIFGNMGRSYSGKIRIESGMRSLETTKDPGSLEAASSGDSIDSGINVAASSCILCLLDSGWFFVTDAYT